MDPITLIIVGLGILFGGTAATAAGIYIAYLTLGEVMEWFRSQRYMLFNRGAVATTIVDLLNNGEYRTVQGVFNTSTQTWAVSRTIQSRQISPDLAYLHRNNRVVIHEV
jgi:hypothetical protein